MARAKNKRDFGKIGDLVEELGQREIPAVYERAIVGEIIDAFVKSHHSRVLYVVDEEARLKGVISLGNLIRHVFFLYHDPYVDTRNLISMAISQTAKDFMQREPLFCVESDDLEDVLQRMIKHNVKEIPVLDDEKRIVADLTMVDLLKRYKHIKGPELF
ncbi:MAG: CBS domain-containing protein [Desulfobacterales bacterium]|nr:CBS domain-containing protein [Desulfobacterales bacterium]